MTTALDQEAEVRRLFFAEHWRVGTIVAQLGLHRQRTFQEHLEIVEAVEKRDVAALHAILRIHIAEMEPNYANALQLV